MKYLITEILSYTAWQVPAPEMYGAFHLIISAVLIFLAVFAACRVRHLHRDRIIRLLSACGWVLVAMEIYKQLFLYYIVNNGVYDWWYFPFQLCSVPMYLCILLPLLCRRQGQVAGMPLQDSQLSGASYRRAPANALNNSLCNSVLTFLAGYTFIGAAATFIVPEDILRPYVALTLHGFIWHGILLFISLTVALSGLADFSVRGIARSVALFLCLCAAAVAINIDAEPAMSSAHSAGLLGNSYAAMFYVNPYHISPQPIVDTVQKSAGIPAGLALYILTIIIAASLADLFFRSLALSVSRNHASGSEGM